MQEKNVQKAQRHQVGMMPNNWEFGVMLKVLEDQRLWTSNWRGIPVGIYIFKVNNKDIRTMPMACF